MLFDDLNRENIQARKDKNELVKNVTMMLLNEIKKEAKELNIAHDHLLTDALVHKCAKKLYKQTQDALENRVVSAADELKILKQYLPKTLTPEETERYIKENFKDRSKSEFGSIMKELKYRNDLDMKLVAKYLKEVLC